MRMQSDPSVCFDYIQAVRKNLDEAGGTNTNTSTNIISNTTRSQACADVSALQLRMLQKHPGVAEQLRALGTELEVQHGGASVVASTTPLVSVHIANFAVTSKNTAFWGYVVDGISAASQAHANGCLCVDRDFYRWASNSAKAGRSVGEDITGYNEFAIEYEHELANLALKWLKPCGGVIATHSEPAYQLFTGKLHTPHPTHRLREIAIGKKDAIDPFIAEDATTESTAWSIVQRRAQ